MRFLITLTCLALVIGTLTFGVDRDQNNHATPEMMRAYKAAQSNI